MTTRVKRGRVVLLALLLAVLAACGGDDSDEGGAATTEPPGSTKPTDTEGAYAPQPLDEPATLTFSTSGPFEFIFPVHLAIEKGEFAKEGLTVEIVTVPANAQLAGLAGGEADIVGIGASAAAMNAIDQGIELSFFQNTHDAPSEGTTEGIWVRKELLDDDGALDPDKVDGMKVVLGTQGLASPTIYVAREMVEDVGRSIDDIEVTVLEPNADSLVALENGAVDAAHLLSPFSDDPALEDCCALVHETVAAGKYAALRSDLEDRPEVYEAFTRALIRTQRGYLQGNYHQDADVAAILAEFTGAPIETVEAAQTWYGFGDEARNDDELVIALQEMWLDFGEILSYTEPLAIEDMSTQAIVDAVNGS